jgi:hypothetical protein
VGALGLVEPASARDELLADIAAGDVIAALGVPTDTVDLTAGRLPFRIDRTDGGRAAPRGHRLHVGARPARAPQAGRR